MYASVSARTDNSFADVHVNIVDIGEDDFRASFHTSGNLYFSLDSVEVKELHQLLADIMENPKDKRFRRDS